MKHLGALVLIVLSALVAAQTSQDRSVRIFDEANTGNGFLRRCSMLNKGTTQEEAGDIKYCIGYFDGLLAATDMWNGSAGTKRFYCIPTNPTTGRYEPDNGQLLRVLFKYIEDHPESSHLLTSHLLLRALKQAFPCRVQRH